jgi:hypothetical protein
MEENNIHEEMITTAENGYLLFKDDFADLLRAYRGLIKDEVIEDLAKRDKSHIVTPLVKGLVNRMTAGFSSAYFSNESFANISPVNAQNEQTAIKKQKAFDFYWSKSGMKPFIPLSKNFLDVTIYGTTVSKVYWNGTYPKIEHININDIWFDPSANSKDDSRYFVHRFYLTQDDIRELKRSKVYNSKFNINEIVPFVKDNIPFDSVQNVKKVQRIELYDVYVKEKGVWKVSTLYTKGVYLRKNIELKDGLPFFVGYCMPRTVDPEETEIRIYGDSPIAPVIGMQDELSLRNNQEIDAIKEILNPSYFSEAGSGLQESKLKGGSGKVVQVNDLTKLQRVTENVTGVLQSSQDRLVQNIKAITGIDVFISADNTAMINRQTADGMNIISNEANMRMDNYIRTFNETFIEPMCEHIMKLIWRYSNEQHLFKGIDRSEDALFNVSVNAGLGATSTQVKLQGLDNAFQKFMALQDAEKANRTIKDSLPLLGIKNTTDYFPDDDDEEAKAQKEQQQQEQMQKQQQMEQIQMEKEMAELEKIKAETQKAIEELQLKAQASQIEAEKIQLEHESNMGKIRNKDRELDIKEYELELQGYQNQNMEINND